MWSRRHLRKIWKIIKNRAPYVLGGRVRIKGIVEVKVMATLFSHVVAVEVCLPAEIQPSSRRIIIMVDIF